MGGAEQHRRRPAATIGKSALDDLRDGKPTVLVCPAMLHASRSQTDQLRELLGFPALTEDQASASRGITAATGADRMVEEMITERYRLAFKKLKPAPKEPAAIDALRHLADRSVSGRQ